MFFPQLKSDAIAFWKYMSLVFVPESGSKSVCVPRYRVRERLIGSPASKEARVAASASLQSCCTCGLEGTHHLTRLLKRAHSLLHEHGHDQELEEHAEKMTSKTLIECRDALTRHLITTLVALHEVNRELERIILGIAFSTFLMPVMKRGDTAKYSRA